MSNIKEQKEPYRQEISPGTYSWCSCGLSQKDPFCDGSHKGTEYKPIKVVIQKEQKVAWCSCKQSKNGAFCDGSHQNL